MRRARFVILVLSLLLTLFYVQAYDVPAVAASTIYQGDLVLTGNNVTIIEGIFDINGSIIVEDNATLQLKNAYLYFTQSQPMQYHIWFRNPSNGNPRLLSYNSTINSTYATDGIKFFENSTASINNSSILGGNSLFAFAYSTISILNGSIVSRGTFAESIVAYESSVVNIDNSTIGSIWSLYSIEPQLQIHNSEIGILIISATSVNCSISKLEPGLIGFWNFINNCSASIQSEGSTSNVTLVNTYVNDWYLDFYGNSTATISNSTTDHIFARDSSIISFKSSSNQYIYAGDSSLLVIEDSDFTEIRPSGSSTWWLLNTTYNKIYPGTGYSGNLYVSWYLDVHVADSIAQDVPDATVTVTFPNGTVADSKQTNSNGLAQFQLMEKIVNASDVDYVAAEYPIGNYTVEGEYDTHLGSTTVNLTETKQVNLALEFVIPEFSSLMLISTFIIATIAVIIVNRRKQQH
jgi:hypothetical protein